MVKLALSIMIVLHYLVATIVIHHTFVSSTQIRIDIPDEKGTPGGENSNQMNGFQANGVVKPIGGSKDSKSPGDPAKPGAPAKQGASSGQGGAGNPGLGVSGSTAKPGGSGTTGKPGGSGTTAKPGVSGPPTTPGPPGTRTTPDPKSTQANKKTTPTTNQSKERKAGTSSAKVPTGIRIDLRD